MSGYARHNPTNELGVDADGTRTAEIARIGDLDFYDAKNRMPAFVGLAKATGGFYAENEKGMTLDKAMTAARMNFTVRFQDGLEFTTVDDDGTTTVSYPHRGTYARWPDGSTAGLGMVGSRYQLVQPAEAGAVGQHVMDESDASIVAAGIYGEPHGSKTYMAFKLPEGFLIGREDRYDLYMTILNSFDGSTKITGLVAPIRFACTNMTTVTFGKTSNRFEFTHTGNIEDKLKDARAALGLARTWTKKWQTSAERLLAVDMRGRAIDRYLERVLPTPESVTTERAQQGWASKRFEIKTIITKSDTCEFGRNTAYAALQGVHEWADWQRPTKRAGDAGAVTRFTRILDGGETEVIKRRAATLLLAR